MVKATPPKGLANTPVIPLPGVWDWVGWYPKKDPGGRRPGGLREEGGGESEAADDSYPGRGVRPRPE